MTPFKRLWAFFPVRCARDDRRGTISRFSDGVLACSSVCRLVDATTPAGKLQMHILGAIAEFERETDSRTGRDGPTTPGLETRNKYLGHDLTSHRATVE